MTTLISTILAPAVVRTVHYDMTSSAAIARYVARHPYAWPGGYQMWGVFADGELLCPDCCRENYLEIRLDEDNPRGCWHLVGLDHAGQADYFASCAHCDTVLHDPEEDS
jgi:hypothetical protein